METSDLGSLPVYQMGSLADPSRLSVEWILVIAQRDLEVQGSGARGLEASSNCIVVLVNPVNRRLYTIQERMK